MRCSGHKGQLRLNADAYRAASAVDAAVPVVIVRIHIAIVARKSVQAGNVTVEAGRGICTIRTSKST